MDIYLFSNNSWIKEINKQLELHWLIREEDGSEKFLTEKDESENDKNKSQWEKWVDIYVYSSDLSDEEIKKEKEKILNKYKYKKLNEENSFTPKVFNSLRENLVQMAYIATNHHIANLSFPYFFDVDMSEIFDLYSKTLKECENKYKNNTLLEDEKIALLYFVFKMKYKINKFSKYLETVPLFNDFANVREVIEHENFKNINVLKEHKKEIDYFYLLKRISIIVSEIIHIKNFHEDVRSLLNEFVEENNFTNIEYKPELFKIIEEDKLIVNYKDLPWLRDIQRLIDSRRSHELLALRDIIQELDLGYKLYKEKMYSTYLIFKVEALKNKDIGDICKSVFEILSILEVWRKNRKESILSNYEETVFNSTNIKENNNLLKMLRKEEQAEIYFDNNEGAVDYVRKIQREKKLLNLMNNPQKNIKIKGKV